MEIPGTSIFDHNREENQAIKECMEDIGSVDIPKVEKSEISLDHGITFEDFKLLIDHQLREIFISASSGADILSAEQMSKVSKLLDDSVAAKQGESFVSAAASISSTFSLPQPPSSPVYVSPYPSALFPPSTMPISPSSSPSEPTTEIDQLKEESYQKSPSMQQMTDPRRKLKQKEEVQIHFEAQQHQKRMNELQQREQQEAVTRADISLNHVDTMLSEEELHAARERELATLPAQLEVAITATNCLCKSAIKELSSYANPPYGVDDVVKAVGVLLLTECKTWLDCRRLLGGKNFLTSIRNFDMNNISRTAMKKLKKFLDLEHFQYKIIALKSKGAADLCRWVLAVTQYDRLVDRRRILEAENDAYLQPKHYLK